MKVLKFEMETPPEMYVPHMFWIETPLIEPMDVQVQDGKVVMWVCVMSKTIIRKRPILCVGTGWEMNRFGMRYAGTVQFNGSVWHYFVGDV